MENNHDRKKSIVILDAYATATVVERMKGHEEAPSGLEDTRYAALTKREREILHLLSQGYSNRAVAKRLSISAKTVSNRRANLMKKLDLGSYPELVRYACGIGFVSSRSFSKGTPVFIRIRSETDPAKKRSLPEGLRSATLAQVTWSRPLSSERETVYETGVQYFL